MPKLNEKETRIYIPKTLYNNPTIIKAAPEHSSEDLKRTQMELIHIAAKKENEIIEIALKSPTISAALAFHDELIERHRSKTGHEMQIPQSDPLVIQYRLSGRFSEGLDLSQILVDLATSGTRGGPFVREYR